jgi:hypothetical protein
MKFYERNLKKKTNGVKNARPVHVSETWEQIVILGSSWNFFFSDKEIQIFRCFNLIKFKFLFIFTTDPYKEIDRQKVLICFTI